MSVPALPAELNIYVVAELRARWLALLAKKPRGAKAAGAPFILDAAAVVEADGAGLQLLLALQRSLSEAGRALQLRAPSAALRAACTAAGATCLLEAAA